MDTTQSLSALASENANGDISALAENKNAFFHSISCDIPPLQPNNKYSDLSYQVPDKFIISKDQVEKSLSRVKLGKSPGPDNIPAWILRDFAPVLSAPVASLLNISIRDGFVPELWKTAIVTAIPKKKPKSLSKQISDTSR